MFRAIRGILHFVKNDISSMTQVAIQSTIDYKYGFHKPENYVFKAKKGLSKEIVEEISRQKREPPWMRDFRLKSLEIFLSKEMPKWGRDLSNINFDDIYYYLKPIRNKAKSWDTYRRISRTPTIG